MTAPLLPPLPEPLPPEVLAAYAFVDGMVARADEFQGSAPLWHGWALREAYKAGVVAERERAALVCEGERVDAEATGEPTDAAYNRATEHCAAAIREGPA